MRLVDADELIEHACRDKLDSRELIVKMIEQAPTIKEISTKIPIDIFDKLVLQEPKTGHCKDCKYFEYDSVAKVDGIPLIVAHEICSKWGDGCKTKEDGYCFLFEPQESEDKEVSDEST